MPGRESRERHSARPPPEKGKNTRQCRRERIAEHEQDDAEGDSENQRCDKSGHLSFFPKSLAIKSCVLAAGNAPGPSTYLTCSMYVPFVNK